MASLLTDDHVKNEVLTVDVLDRIKGVVDASPVVLFMKGSPKFPMCGYSSRTAEALTACGEEFTAVNVLEDPEVFENLPRFADWPTFPQLYIKGELVGGCDITLELYRSGELKQMVRAAVGKEA